jgi:hypothetical protein
MDKNKKFSSSNIVAETGCTPDENTSVQIDNNRKINNKKLTDTGGSSVNLHDDKQGL